MLDTGRLGCACLDPECSFDAFHETDIGSVLSGWQSFNVSLFDCRHCGSRWMHCAKVEQDDAPIRRWYRGPLSARQLRTVSAENALAILAGLPWYFYGGTEFETAGDQGLGPALLEFDPVASVEENDWTSLSR